MFVSILCSCLNKGHLLSTELSRPKSWAWTLTLTPGSLDSYILRILDSNYMSDLSTFLHVHSYGHIQGHHYFCSFGLFKPFSRWQWEWCFSPPNAKAFTYSVVLRDKNPLDFLTWLTRSFVTTAHYFQLFSTFFFLNVPSCFLVFASYSFSPGCFLLPLLNWLTVNYGSAVGLAIICFRGLACHPPFICYNIYHSTYVEI